MLLPLDTLVSKGRSLIFREHPTQVWVEPTQMDFTHDGKEVSAANGLVWLGTGWSERNELAWLTHGKGPFTVAA